MENIPESLSVLGKEFLEKNTSNKAENQAIPLTNKVTGLLFSAHWCKSCQEFTSLLEEFYQKLKLMGADFQIIFISSDQNVNAFNKYFSKMPWIAVPFGDDRIAVLRTKYRIIELPSLVFIDPFSGKVLSIEGKEIVLQEDYNKLLDWCGFGN